MRGGPCAEQPISLAGAGWLREAANLRTGFPGRDAALSRPERCLRVSERSLESFGLPKLSVGPSAISASADGVAHPKVRTRYGLFAATVRERGKRRRATGVADLGHGPDHFDRGMISAQGASTEEG